jgi:hypothetical protein
MGEKKLSGSLKKGAARGVHYEALWFKISAEE